MSDPKNSPKQHNDHVVQHLIGELESRVFNQGQWGKYGDKLRYDLFKESGTFDLMNSGDPNPYWHKRATQLGVLFSCRQAGDRKNYGKLKEKYLSLYPSAKKISKKGDTAPTQEETQSVDELLRDLEESVFVKGDWNQVAQERIRKSNNPSLNTRVGILQAAWMYRAHGYADKYQEITDEYSSEFPETKELLEKNRGN